MVNYGKSLRNARRQEWEDAYLDYDRLKTALYRMDPSASIRDGQVQEEYEDGAGEETPLLLTSPAVSAASSHARDQQERLSQPISAFSLNELLETGKAFLAELHTEIEKVTLFSLKKQGEIADQVGSLRFEHYSGKDRLFSGTTNTAALSSSPEDQACEAYARVGVELLHLLRFICINATGIHKILKKYEKTVYAVLNEISPNFEDDVLETTALQQLKHALDTTTAATRATPILKGRKATAVTPRTTLRHRTHKRQPTQPDFTTGTTTMSFHKNGPGSHLQELANSASIAAIHASLGLALQQQMEYELQQKLQQREPSDSLLRFHFVMASIETLRHSADLVNSPFSNFLSRKAMIATGANLGGMEASTLEQLRRLLMFEPDIILNLPYEDLLDWYRTTIFEDDRDAGFGISIRISDPVAVMSEQKSRAAGHRRKQSHLESMHTMSAFPSGVSGGDKAWGGVDSKTLTINLLSTLLYTVNYYIVAPNANRYAVLLGQDGAYGATLIGASSFAALFAAFVYSFWYTKASFRSALIFSSLCALIGNLLYALAISYESMSMALWGRILCGFGSAEVVNRQLISTCVSFERLTRASAFFVAVGAAGMSIGPLLGSIFDMISGRDSEVDLDMPFMPAGGIVFDHVTLPGFFMAGLWMLQMCLLLIFFLEPERINVIKSSKNRILTPNTDLSFTARPDDHEQLVADLFETKAGATTAGNMHGDEVIERNDEGSKGIGNICWLITSEVSSTAKLIVQNPGLPVGRHHRSPFFNFAPADFKLCSNAMDNFLIAICITGNLDLVLLYRTGG